MTNLGEITDHHEDTKRAATDAGMEHWIPATEEITKRVGDALTPEEIRALRRSAELLICGLIHVTKAGPKYGYDPDKILTLCNALTGEIWHELDRLCMLAGGLPQLNDLKYAIGSEEYPGQAEAARFRFAAAFNRLLAEVEPDAHVASVHVTVHNADGSEVTYSTAPHRNPLLPKVPIWRTVQPRNHDARATFGDDGRGD